MAEGTGAKKANDKTSAPKTLKEKRQAKKNKARTTAGVRAAPSAAGLAASALVALPTGSHDGGLAGFGSPAPAPGANPTVLTVKWYPRGAASSPQHARSQGRPRNGPFGAYLVSGFD